MSYMGQLTIYLPEEIERSVKRNARRAKKSVSAYIASLEKNESPRRRGKNGHPAELWELFGSMPDFKLPPDPPPEVLDLGPAFSSRQRRLRRRSQRR